VNTRLAQFIRLLSSDQDGEVVSAARALCRTLASSGLDIHAVAAVVEHATLVSTAAPRAAEPPPSDWQGAVRWLASRPHLLNQWEIGFITSLQGWTGDELTDAQMKKLDAIYAKVQRVAA
jgi:hypothetical protein